MKQNIEVLLRNITLVFTLFLLAGLLKSCSDKDDIIEEEEPPPSTLPSKYDGSGYKWGDDNQILELAIYKDPSGNERKVVNLYQLNAHDVYYTEDDMEFGYLTAKYHELWRNDEFLGDFIVVPNKYGLEKYKLKLVHLPSMREITIYDFSNWTEGTEVCSEYFRIDSDRNVEVMAHKEVVRDPFEYKLVGIWGNTWDPFLAFHTDDGGLMVRPYGRISGKRSIMPIEFVDEDPADEYILLAFHSYIHRDFDELTKDAEYAYTTDEFYDRYTLQYPLLNY